MQETSRPNILFILSDQHRARTTGCYGHAEIKTPHMDHMAREGLRFTQCMSGSPICMPYRATLQTGLYMHQHGVTPDNKESGLKAFKGLAHYFNEADYNTCYIGKSHWTHQPPIGEERMGWKHWLGAPNHNHFKTRLYDEAGNIREELSDQWEPALQTQWAMDFIEEQASDQPWCMQLNWGPPHSCYGIDDYDRQPEIWQRIREINERLALNIPEHKITDDCGGNPVLCCPQSLISRIVPQEYLDMYPRDTLTLESNVPEHWYNLARYYYQEYYAMITALDEEIGKMLDYLKRSGKDKNTIVIYTSDHGEHLCSENRMRGKSSPHQNALRVPLIIWGPQANIEAGKEKHALVNSVDFMPTLLELAGITPDTKLPGTSFSASLGEGEENKQQDILMGLRRWRGIFDGRFIYAIEHPHHEKSWSVIQFSDTTQDEFDENNLAGKAEFAEDQQRLHERLMFRLREEQDHQFLEQIGE